MRLLIIFVISCAQVACGFEVRGAPWNAQSKCWEGERVAGYSYETGADTVITHATDESGRVWRFRDSIIPDDFTDGIRSGDPTEISYSWEDCP